MSNDYTLPPVPSLRLYQRGYERFDMEDYGHACAEHVRAPLLARIAELDGRLTTIHGAYSHAELLRQNAEDDRDRLRAENEALRADLEWISVEWGGIRHDYAAWVLRRGGTGDLGDLRSFIDAARSTGQSKAEGDSNAHR